MKKSDEICPKKKFFFISFRRLQNHGDNKTQDTTYVYTTWCESASVIQAFFIECIYFYTNTKYIIHKSCTIFYTVSFPKMSSP